MDIWNISSSSSSTSASFSSHHLASHSPHSVVLPSSISSTSASAFSSLSITVTAAAATMTNSTAVLAAALNSTTSGTTTKGTILMEEPPVEAWCFDLLLFYRSVGEDDPQAKNVLAELEAYAKFSFVVNGLVTCLLVIFGLLGNALFVAQLHGKSNHFSRRLANHLTALCVWDIALLCCCLCSYGVICMCVGILPFVGITAYLLYLFQPFASFCVTGTIWQVLAITVERYKAVSRPLEQRTRKGQFSLRVICGCIVAGAFALNFLAVPFERALVDCYEFRSEGFEVRTMIVQQELVNAQYYAILSHLIPDLLFRAPTPIIAIAILTVRTLGLASAQRTIGHQQIVPQRQRALGRNVHLMLTLLSVKFVLCNTLYLFNTILMEIMGYGGKTSSQQTELEMEQYIRSLYLTDFSNMLLAIHSATNWLIFYKWPKCTEEKKKRVAASFTLSASSSTDLNKSVPIDSQTAQVIFKRFREAKEEICANILVSLCSNSPSIVKALGLADGHQPEFINQKTFLHEGSQRNHCMLMADIIEAVISPLTKANYDGDAMLEWRDFCRQIGYHYCKVNAYLNADQWKLVRTQLIMALSRNSPHQQQQHSPSISSICQHNYPSKWQPQYKVHQAVLSYHQKALIRTFNCALREMKNGAIFALVDESQKRLGGSGYKALGALAGGTPIRLIKRMSWISGPPAGIVARAIFPRPSSSRDSFSLVFSSNETDQSCQNREEEEEENTEKSGIGCSSSRGISIIVPLHESAALLVGGGATKMTTGGGKMTTNELAVRRMTLLNSSERKPLAEIGHGEGGLHLFRS